MSGRFKLRRNSLKYHLRWFTAIRITLILRLRLLKSTIFPVDKSRNFLILCYRDSNVPGVRAPQKVVLEVGQDKHPHQIDILTGCRVRQREAIAVVQVGDLIISTPIGALTGRRG